MRQTGQLEPIEALMKALIRRIGQLRGAALEGPAKRMAGTLLRDLVAEG